MTLPEPSTNYDISDDCAMTCWFRRDRFNDDMYLAAKGGASANTGWMIKCCDEGYLDSIRFYIHGSGNIYRTFRPIIDRYDHFFGMVWHADEKYADEIWKHRMELPVPAGGRCDVGDGDAYPLSIVIDKYSERIWKAWGTPISAVTPYDGVLNVGGQCDNPDRDPWAGTVHTFDMYHGIDITLQDIIDYYNSTRGSYVTG